MSVKGCEGTAKGCVKVGMRESVCGGVDGVEGGWVGKQCSLESTLLPLKIGVAGCNKDALADTSGTGVLFA